MKLAYHDQGLEYTVRNSNSKDLLLVISASGQYANGIKDDINNFNGHSILVTTNRLDDFKSYFDDVYFLSHLDHSTDANIYRQYGLNYFFDIIANHLEVK